MGTLDLAELFKVMADHGVFHLEMGDLKVEFSQYKYAPKAPELPKIPDYIPPPRQADISDYPLELRAAYEAFKPTATVQQPIDEPLGPPMDPTDPNAPLNDDELFATQLPQPS